MPAWLWVVIIVIIALAALSYFRRRGPDRPSPSS